MSSSTASSSSSSPSTSIHFSLNRKDELDASSPEASLQSLGVTSGDLIFFTLNPTAFSSSSSQTLAPNSDSNSNSKSVQQPPQALAPNSADLQAPSEIPRESPIMEEIPSSQGTPVRDFSLLGPEIADCHMNDSTMAQEEGGSVVFNSENEGTVDFSGAEMMEMDDGSASMVKKFSERCFLKRVLSEEQGDYGGDHRLLVIGVHAVLLESGFVGIDSVTGLRVDRLQVADEWPSNAFSLSLWYTLPELLQHGSGDFVNAVESVVLKFQSLGHFINIYGSLSKAGSGLYRVCLNENKFVPAISLAKNDSIDRTNEDDGYPETEIFEFWKIVKDGLALPLLIDLCERAGLVPPPCFIRLPADLKLKILEYLPGVDLAKVGCVCSELLFLSSNNELWKGKYVEEAGQNTVTQGCFDWKSKFASFWENKKKRKGAGVWARFHSVLRPVYHERHPFGTPYMVGGDYDRAWMASRAGPSGGVPRLHPLRRNFRYHLGGSRV